MARVARGLGARRRRETRSWRGHVGEVRDLVKGYEILDCRQCQFIHIIPIPTQREIEKIYRPSYYKVEKPDYIRRQRRDMGWWELVYKERYETFESLLPPSRRRILDVGSGPGFFLQYGKRRGWDTMGVEPARQAVAHSRKLGLEVVEDLLDRRTAASLGQFDVVHMQEVLEHLTDPAETFRIVRDILKPGGLLSITAPNDYNPMQEALRRHLGYSPWWLAPPHHINYFSFSSLARLLRRSGFKIVSKSTTFPMEVFLLMGANYVGNDVIGRRVHGMRKELEVNLARIGAEGWLKRFYQALARLGLGRECVLLGRRIGGVSG